MKKSDIVQLNENMEISSFLFSEQSINKYDDHYNS